MITNKTVYEIKQYLTNLSSESIDTFVFIVFVIFVDTFSITDVILSHVITEVSAILFKYLLFSQMQMLGYEL